MAPDGLMFRVLRLRQVFLVIGQTHAKQTQQETATFCKFQMMMLREFLDIILIILQMQPMEQNALRKVV